MKKVKIALSQLNLYDGEKSKNLDNILSSVEKAYHEKADILVLPEMCLTGGASHAKMLELSEPRMGESMQKVIDQIKKYPVHTVFSFPEYGGKNIIYNTSCFINKNGIPLEYYRKVHLFDSERYVFNRGDEYVEAKIDDLKIGLLTCYDIEFPEVARSLALKGVSLIVAPTCNMLPYDHRHKVFIQSRGLENHVFVAYCNRVGANSKVEYHGDSAVIDPFGRKIIELKGDTEQFQVCEIDLEEVERSKEVFNYLEERRPDTYY